MKRVFVLGLTVIAIVGFYGCGKSKEKSMNDALQQAASGVEGTTEQGNFVVYEGDVTNAVSPAATAPAAQEAAVQETPAASAVTTDKPTNEQIQQALKGAGLYNGPVDGKIGPKTKQAIRKFQIQNELTVDGKVGKKTWSKMQPFLSGSASPAAAPAAAAPAQTSTESGY